MQIIRWFVNQYWMWKIRRMLSKQGIKTYVAHGPSFIQSIKALVEDIEERANAKR